MPAYNCESCIEDAIRSVIAQTEEDWELLIVDDCSTDATAARVECLAAREPRIRFVRLSQNGGAAVARSEALRRASGRYVAFLDGDDLWDRRKLERQLAFMRETGAPFSATAYDQIDETGRPLSTVCLPPRRTGYRKLLLLSNPLGNSTVMYDQRVLGRFELPRIRRRNDFALWLKLLRVTPCCMGMDEILTHYRVRRKNVRSKLALARYHWRLYREVEQLGVLESAFYLGCWALVKGSGIGLRRRKRAGGRNCAGQ